MEDIQANDLCTGYDRNSIHQIQKKDNDTTHTSKYNIFPLTYIQAVYDARDGRRLDTILEQCNNLYVYWKGSREATRLQLPMYMRRRGIIITYRDGDNNIVTEQCINADRIADDVFGKDENWELISYRDLTEEDLRNVNKYGFNVTVFGMKGGTHTLESAIKDVPYDSRILGQKITFAKNGCEWVTYQFQSLSLDCYEDPSKWKQTDGIQRVNGSVHINNQADEEDITSTSDNLLKFADKEYNEDSFSGLGRVYLRKNIQKINVDEESIKANALPVASIEDSVPTGLLDEIAPAGDSFEIQISKDGKAWAAVYDADLCTRYLQWNATGDYKADSEYLDSSDNLKVGSYICDGIVYDWNGTGLVEHVYEKKTINLMSQDMFIKANTRYIIQYDYDLNCTTINIPEGCVLEFQGGSLNNGKLNGANTKVYGIGLTDTISLSGTFDKINFNNFKINDDISLIITELFKVVATVNIPNGEYNARTVVVLPEECSIYGQSLKTVIHVFGTNMFSFTTYGFRRTIANLTLIGTGETENIPDSGNPIPGTVDGTTSQIAITMSGAHETHIYNMEIDNFMRAINVSLNCWETHMHDIRIRSCDEGIFNGTWTIEENMMEYNRISCMYCGIGFQFYNGYLQTLNGCRAELCNTGIKIGGTLNQVNIVNSYLERNHNRSIWFMDGSASVTLIDGCYFAVSEYPETQTWDGKPDKVNDIYFEGTSDTNNVTIKNCWFNPLGTSLVDKENYYIINTNNRQTIVLENNIYNGASGRLKLFASNQYLNRFSNKDYKPLYHNWENWLNITDTNGVIDLSSYPIISSNFVISFSNEGKELTSIEIKMPIVSDFLTDQRYEDIVYNLMVPYTNSSIGNVQYIKFTQVSSTDYMPIQHAFVKGSKNGGNIVKLRLVSPLEGDAQWRLFSEDVETYSNSVPQSQVVLPSKMTDEEKEMFTKRSLWFTTATPEYIPTYFDGTYWRKWNGDRALNINGFYLHTSGDSENLPRVESTDTNFRFFNTDYAVGLIYNGSEWVNEDGTLFNKVNII